MLRLFTEHPASVGESYLQHLRFASRTGATMLTAGMACIVHGLFPFLFVTTGSRTIRQLAARLGGAQRRHVAQMLQFKPSRHQHAGGRGLASLDRPAVAESLNSAAL